jgi:hypothetical protein
MNESSNQAPSDTWARMSYKEHRSPEETLLVPPKRLRVMLCHANADLQRVRRLHAHLRSYGVRAWLDESGQTAGVDGRPGISRQLRKSHAVMVCITSRSVSADGSVLEEIRVALDLAEEGPDESIVVVPVLMERCAIPERLARWPSIALFEDTEQGLNRLLSLLSARAGELGIELSLGKGAVIDKYEIHEIIGWGSLSTVHRAVDERIGRDVAAKIIRLGPKDEPKTIELLKSHQTAVRVGAKMVHPNIVAVYDWGELHDAAYVIMEFIRGQSLANFVRHDPLPMVTVLHQIARVARALHYVHEAGYIHNNVKPAQVLYAPDVDATKLNGFSWALPIGTRLRKSDKLRGTPAFMSPEQIAREPMDAASDLFALGITLHQLLTGELPFPGSGAVEIMKNIALGRLHVSPGGLPADVVDIVKRCLAPSPDDRYRSGLELHEELQGAISRLEG